jgi:hypothetical protein
MKVHKYVALPSVSPCEIKDLRPPAILMDRIGPINYLFHQRLLTHLVSHISVVVESVRHGQRQVQIFGPLKQQNSLVQETSQSHTGPHY